MKKIIYFVLLIFILSGCSIDWNNEKAMKIDELNNKIEKLEKELSDLKSSNDIELQKLELEKEKNDELKLQEDLKNKNKEKCLVEAHERFVEEGNSLCAELGYSLEDIYNLKCRLPNDELKHIENRQNEAKDFCLKLYK